MVTLFSIQASKQGTLLDLLAIKRGLAGTCEDRERSLDTMLPAVARKPSNGQGATTELPSGLPSERSARPTCDERNGRRCN